ncbi:MAG: phosphatidylserine decarboxylase family protein [Cytophagales bacterium]|nr:MAG: phosphatidylserine decarboxylase family protein [Cytophagales bacterium]
MTIHREGYPTLALVTTLLGIINFAIWQLLPDNNIVQNIVLIVSIILFFIVLQFFRNPTVVVPTNPNHVLAPCDGKVVVIEETIEEEYFKTPRRQVSIFMSPINVHVNRNPISGVVRYCKYHAGKYLVAWHPKSSTENERTSIVIQHEKGAEVLMRQIAGALARRICWYVNEKQIVKQGEEFGFIKFGSRVDLYLPLDAKISVKIDDITKAGVTVVAELS